MTAPAPTTLTGVTIVRLDAATSQATFRLLLDAFAHPGRPVALGPIAQVLDVHPVLLPALALADLETSIAVVDDPEQAAAAGRLLARSTGVRLAGDLTEADLVVATGTATAADITLLRRGDAFHPELGARLALRCRRLDDGTDGPNVRIAGPGARSGRIVGVDLDPSVLAALNAANADHPAGVDTWLIDDEGRCVGIPRSATIELTGRDREGND